MQPGKRVYFKNNIRYLRGMRIDSVRSVGVDTVFYPFHSVRGKFHTYSSTEPPIGVLDSMGGSWLGGRIVERPDGTTVFDNIWNDTIEQNETSANSVAVYPNPAEDFVIIKSNDQSLIKKVSVYDVTGRTVTSATPLKNVVELSTSHLPTVPTSWRLLWEIVRCER